jgi:hypothetical protein
MDVVGARRGSMVVLYQDGEEIRRDAKGTRDIRTIYCVCTPIDEYYVKYTNIAL